MNELIKIMADDMKIRPYTGETDGSYEYRVIYSALGLWCLKSALSEKEKKREISKNAQTMLLHRLLEKYLLLCPASKRFLLTSQTADAAVQIRNLYEQTGYLITKDNNYNTLNNSGETVKISDEETLYLGIPNEEYTLNGLGIYCKEAKHEISLNDFLIRDNLSPEEYLLANFNPCDFEARDINLDELEFFNPFYCGRLSEAWRKYRNSDMTIARKNTIGPYYRVMEDNDGNILFAEENSTNELNAMTGAEFRRIYIALKEYYLNPMRVLICPIDNEYSYIRILGQLPNREYYYLLLNSWPKYKFTDRNNFIIRNTLTVQTIKILKNIGFEVRKGEFYG